MSEEYKSIDIPEFFKYLNILQTIKNREDAELLVRNMEKLTDDDAQLDCLSRILRRMSYSKEYLNTEDNNNNNNNTDIGECPHCGKTWAINKNTQYTICGLTNTGFSWSGCGRDWCFKCGKKLCKIWNTHQLFNTLNRHHDIHCCKRAAQRHNQDYNKEYCRCDKVY